MIPLKDSSQCVANSAQYEAIYTPNTPATTATTTTSSRLISRRLMTADPSISFVNRIRSHAHAAHIRHMAHQHHASDANLPAFLTQSKSGGYISISFLSNYSLTIDSSSPNQIRRSRMAAAQPPPPRHPAASERLRSRLTMGSSQHRSRRCS